MHRTFCTSMRSAVTANEEPVAPLAWLVSEPSAPPRRSTYPELSVTVAFPWPGAVVSNGEKSVKERAVCRSTLPSNTMAAPRV